MAKQDWLNYFDFLTKLANTLEGLAVLQEEKTKAVEKGDLPKVDEMMKQEQAAAMTLRGYEQKRIATLALLNVPAGPIRDLEKSMPIDLRPTGKKAVALLQENYARYQKTAKKSKETLEYHLSRIETHTGVPSGYEKPKRTPDRSLEKEGVLSQKAGNVPLNLRQQYREKEDTPKIHPVSQGQLAQVQAEQNRREAGVEEKKVEYGSHHFAGGNLSDLRQFAQQQERQRTSAVQKHTLEKNSKSEP